MKIDKIGIRFGDNDFGNTVTALFKVMLQASPDEYANTEYTKEKFVEVYNSVIGGIYWLAQNPLNYNGYTFNSFPNFEYLHIDVKDVYFNEEVKNYIERCKGWDNSEFGYIDFNTQEYHFI